MIANHFAWHRVDRRLADTQHQTRPGNRADTAPGDEANARFGVQANFAEEQCAMSHVRIVAGVLDGSRLRAVFGQAAEFQAHLHLFALGQNDLDRIGRQTAEQQTCGGEAGGGGAAAGGQATAQGRRLFGGFITHRKASSRPAG
ncbi:hypothetical protein D3C84_359810 [compost metagenome]